MLQTDIPCCNISTISNYLNHLLLNINNLKIEVEVENPNNSEAEYDKTCVVEQIKHYSHYKDVEKIRQYIDENYSIDFKKGFLNKKPVSVIQIITEGITHFIDIKRNEKIALQ